jgi:hypothetical protein
MQELINTLRQLLAKWLQSGPKDSKNTVLNVYSTSFRGMFEIPLKYCLDFTIVMIHVLKYLVPVKVMYIAFFQL